jgi:hypothetical protein
MTTEELKNKPKEEVMNFIRERLSFDPGIENSIRNTSWEDKQKEHKRFEMSGYDIGTGDCTVWNTSLLNEFADLGIYDYTSYLFLDFYKGNILL